MYKEWNLNPTGKRTADCVVRALMLVTGKTWHEVYDELCKIGREKFSIPNEDKVYSAYLEQQGFIKHKMPKIPVGDSFSRVTVSDFCKRNPVGVYFVIIANHTVGVKDGTYYDTWDCGFKSCGNFWSKK
jgi:hypothetical protein